MPKVIKIDHNKSHEVKAKYDQAKLNMFLNSSINDYENTVHRYD